MNRNVMSRSSSVTVALLLVLTLAPACSGGSGGTVITGPLKAKFTPSGPPVDHGIALTAAGAGATSDLVKVGVVIQDVDSLSGVSLKIQFETATTQFVSGDATGSFLPPVLPGGVCAKLFAAGVVEVGAALEGSQAGLPMTPGQQGTLCTLTFKAIAPTANGTLTILDDPQDLLVSTCPTAGGACGTATVTLVNGVISAQQ